MGTGEDVSIRELPELVQEIVGHEGEIHWDTTKPDGTPRKVMDVSTIEELGWTPKVGLREGIERTYSWYLENPEERRQDSP